MFGDKLSRGIVPNIKTPSLRQNTAGVVQNKPKSAMNPSEALIIENMHQPQEGFWSADKAGYSVVNLNKTPYEAGATIDGIQWFPDSNGVDHLFVAIKGKLKEVNLSDGSIADIDASAGFAVGGQVCMQPFQLGNTPLLFSSDGTVAPRKWDGSALTASAAGGWPVSDGINSFTHPKYLSASQQRLQAANFPGFPSHFIQSDLQKPEVFTQPATVGTDSWISQIGNESGQQILGFCNLPIPKTNSEVTVVFKDRCIYQISGNSSKAGDATVFSPTLINDKYGAFNHRCIIRLNSDVLAMNEHGIISYTAATLSGDVQPVAINNATIGDTLEMINLSQKDKCWAIHLPDRYEIWFGVPTGSSTKVDTILVYRYPTPGDATSTAKWSIRTSAGVFFPSCGVLVNRDFYIGLPGGVVGKMFASSQYDTIGIPWKYAFGKLPYGNEKQYKQILDIEALFAIRTAQTITVQSIWRGGGNNDNTVQSYPLMARIGAVWGQFKWGQAPWGSEDEQSIQIKTPGNGEYHQLILSGTTNASGPVFLGLKPVVRYGAISRSYN
jgi:hypothetical protein